MDRCDVYICYLQSAQMELQKKDLNMEKLNALFELSLSNANLTNGENEMIEFFVDYLNDNQSLMEHAAKATNTTISNKSNTGILLHEERVSINWKENDDILHDFFVSNFSIMGLNTVLGDMETLQYQLIHRYRVVLLTVHIHLSHARLRLFKSFVSKKLSFFNFLFIYFVLIEK